MADQRLDMRRGSEAGTGINSIYSAGYMLPVESRSTSFQDWVKVIAAGAFLAAHIPLALLLHASSAMATMHALLTLAVGLYYAYRGQMQRVACVGAYIVGAEVLWRMAEATIFWEFGKYALVTIFLLTLVKSRPKVTPTLPIIYFVLLLPSSVLLFNAEDWFQIRSQLSFNLAGPLALVGSVYFFSNTKLSKDDLIKLFLSLVGPVVGIAALAIYGISTTEIAFSDNSNMEASGGYGPNQVSTILGLAALLLLFCLFNDRVNYLVKGVILMGVMLLGVQSALTFSRGGLYNAVGAALAAAFYLLRDARSRILLFISATVIVVAAQYIILPRLDSMTEGAITERFQDTGLTGRDQIMALDIQIWKDNFLLGVGPGEAVSYRAAEYNAVAAHTEYTRLLAEHGILGLAALCLLLAAAVQNLFNCRDYLRKGLALSFTCWSLIFMVHAGMRLAAPSFMFGLAFAMVHAQLSPQRLATKATLQARLHEIRRNAGQKRVRLEA